MSKLVCICLTAFWFPECGTGWLLQALLAFSLLIVPFEMMSSDVHGITPYFEAVTAVNHLWRGLCYMWVPESLKLEPVLSALKSNASLNFWGWDEASEWMALVESWTVSKTWKWMSAVVVHPSGTRRVFPLGLWWRLPCVRSFSVDPGSIADDWNWRIARTIHLEEQRASGVSQAAGSRHWHTGGHQTNCCLNYLLWSDDKSAPLLSLEQKMELELAWC